MRNVLLLMGFFFFSLALHSQVLSPEEVLRKLEYKFSPEEIEKVKKEYMEADEMTRAMMLSVFSMPMSSKKELIANLESKRSSIEELIGSYRKLVPKGYEVFLELKTSERHPGLVEGFDFQVYKKDASGELNMIGGDWDLKYDSDELNELLSIIDWDSMTLLGIKNLLQTANCISIRNGELSEVGFARSGLGKYYYMIFPKKLSKKQIEQYSDGCQYLYYRDNIVLKYMGGMAGPQCFTD